MKKINIPEGYNTVMPYLIVKDGLGLIRFLKEVFDAEEKDIHRTDDGGLLHGEVVINSDSCIMISEANEKWGVNNAGLYINVANADESYQKALDKGANSLMEPADQPYGRSCGVTDPFGNIWWITSAL